MTASCRGLPTRGRAKRCRAWCQQSSDAQYSIYEISSHIRSNWVGIFGQKVSICQGKPQPSCFGANGPPQVADLRERKIQPRARHEKSIKDIPQRIEQEFKAEAFLQVVAHFERIVGVPASRSDRCATPVSPAGLRPARSGRHPRDPA
jgi:hypothetical protein